MSLSPSLSLTSSFSVEEWFSWMVSLEGETIHMQLSTLSLELPTCLKLKSFLVCFPDHSVSLVGHCAWDWIECLNQVNISKSYVMPPELALSQSSPTTSPACLLKAFNQLFSLLFLNISRQPKFSRNLREHLYCDRDKT